MGRSVWIAVFIVLAGLVALGFANRKAGQLASQSNLSKPAVKASATTPGGSSPQAGKASAVATPAGGIGYGLTFAVVTEAKLPPEVAYLSCQGEPRQVDRPHKEACNPLQGDTSCRTVLPVLCVSASGAPLPAGVASGLGPNWTKGSLGATQPVMGAILDSEAAASALCVQELGPGWRMAEFTDGPSGGDLVGQRGLGLRGNNRYWVLSKGQPANCWNSAP